MECQTCSRYIELYRGNGWCDACFRQHFLSFNATAIDTVPPPLPNNCWDLLPAEIRLYILHFNYPQKCALKEIDSPGPKRLVSLRNGQLHSYGDKPAITWLDGPLKGRHWYYKDGVPHRPRLQGPAVEFEDGSRWWVMKGQVMHVERPTEIPGNDTPFYTWTDMEREPELRQNCFDLFCLIHQHDPVEYRLGTFFSSIPQWADLYFSSLLHDDIDNNFVHIIQLTRTVQFNHAAASQLCILYTAKVMCQLVETVTPEEIGRILHLDGNITPAERAEIERQNRYLVQTILNDNYPTTPRKHKRSLASNRSSNRKRRKHRPKHRSGQNFPDCSKW